ncbi:hypothetical protein G7Y89_g759 [Cudoniella acicularis]|uniref:Uncharacterized protein n=1 Tax=Cudoniella acicularis TaxID=354080 RepID=A0A8H4W7M7_9HELO|nr:hypothetical protein G7Y89_g759 [Cudoniella acicularis]
MDSTLLLFPLLRDDEPMFVEQPQYPVIKYTWSSAPVVQKATQYINPAQVFQQPMYENLDEIEQNEPRSALDEYLESLNQEEEQSLETCPCSGMVVGPCAVCGQPPKAYASLPQVYLSPPQSVNEDEDRLPVPPMMPSPLAHEFKSSSPFTTDGSLAARDTESRSIVREARAAEYQCLLSTRKWINGLANFRYLSKEAREHFDFQKGQLQFHKKEDWDSHTTEQRFQVLTRLCELLNQVFHALREEENHFEAAGMSRPSLLEMAQDDDHNFEGESFAFFYQLLQSDNFEVYRNCWECILQYQFGFNLDNFIRDDTSWGIVRHDKMWQICEKIRKAGEARARALEIEQERAKQAPNTNNLPEQKRGHPRKDRSDEERAAKRVFCAPPKANKLRQQISNGFSSKAAAKFPPLLDENGNPIKRGRGRLVAPNPGSAPPPPDANSNFIKRNRGRPRKHYSVVVEEVKGVQNDNVEENEEDAEHEELGYSSDSDDFNDPSSEDTIAVLSPPAEDEEMQVVASQKAKGSAAQLSGFWDIVVANYVWANGHLDTVGVGTSDYGA